ncbi:MAG: nucleotide exchange factor GrpE [Cyclobacteriaceae bacterium]
MISNNKTEKQTEQEDIQPTDEQEVMVGEEHTENADQTSESAVENKEESEATTETEGEQDDLSEKLAKLEADLAESKEKYLRLYSEFDNYRKRTAREKADLIVNANEGMLTALLPIVDDFERALAANEDQTDPAILKEGFTLISNKMRNTVEQKGLKIMKIDKGDDFDADIHEAVAQMPVEEQDLKGKIIDIVEKGYYLNEKVIRFAKVVIGS